MDELCLIFIPTAIMLSLKCIFRCIDTELQHHPTMASHMSNAKLIGLAITRINIISKFS